MVYFDFDSVKYNGENNVTLMTKGGDQGYVTVLEDTTAKKHSFEN